MFCLWLTDKPKEASGWDQVKVGFLCCFTEKGSVGCRWSQTLIHHLPLLFLPHLEDEHHHAVHAFISCSWIHNMLIPESITGISCFMFRPKPSQRLPTLHGRALHGFHFHHHVSPGLIPCNYGKNHAVHGTCHGSAWSLCQTQKKVKSWWVIKSFSL